MDSTDEQVINTLLQRDCINNTLQNACIISLNSHGHVMIFIGDNAKDHYLPLAERIISEGVLTGPKADPTVRSHQDIPSFWPL